MHPRLAALAVPFVAFLLLLAGCERNPLISVTLLNRTGGACHSVYINLNGKSEDLGGGVVNGDASISGGWPYPMPAKATLRWVTEDQTGNTVTVSIPPGPPGRADSLDYVFVILPGGRANVAVIGTNHAADGDSQAEKTVAVMNDLGRDGGPNYHVAVKNTTGTDIDNLDVRFGPYAVNAGTHLSATAQNYAIASGLPYPITNSVSIHWGAKDGQAYSNVVAFAKPPSDFTDKCFWFILRDRGDVTVQIVNWSDLRAGKHPELCAGF